MAKKTLSMKDIRRLSDEELVIEVRDQKRRLFDLRSQAVTEKIEDTSQFGKIRRQIARLSTERAKRAKETQAA